MRFAQQGARTETRSRVIQQSGRYVIELDVLHGHRFFRNNRIHFTVSQRIPAVII